MTAIFKREVRSSFHGMIGYVLTAFMLAASAIYFVALNLGYGLTDFGYYTLYTHHFCAAFVYSGAHHALLCRGTPHPHRSAACSPVRCLCGASCWASSLPCASSLHCRALPMRS